MAENYPQCSFNVKSLLTWPFYKDPNYGYVMPSKRFAHHSTFARVVHRWLRIYLIYIIISMRLWKATWALYSVSNISIQQTKTSPTPPTLSKFYTQVPSIIAGDINNIISIIPIQSCPFLSICNAYYKVCIIWKITWRFHISANPYAAQMLWFHHHIYIFQWLLLPKQVVLYNDNKKHINHWPYRVVLWKLYYFNRELFKVVWLE